MWLGLGWTFGVFTLIAVILAQFYWWSSRFILTDRRAGPKKRHPSSAVDRVPFAKHGMRADRVSDPGPLFNYGTLTVRGFGSSRDSIKRVPRPERVRELIEEHEAMSPRVHVNSRKVSGVDPSAEITE